MLDRVVDCLQSILLFPRLAAGLVIVIVHPVLPPTKAVRRDLGMELEGIGGLANAHRLVVEQVAGGQPFGPGRQVEFMEMTLGDMDRLRKQVAARLGGPDFVVAEFAGLSRLGSGIGAEDMGDGLGALAHARQPDAAFHELFDPTMPSRLCPSPVECRGCSCTAGDPR